MLKRYPKRVTARLTLALLCLTLVAANATARSATATPNLVASSVSNGWASITRLVSPPPPWNPSDPPAYQAEGVVEFITSGWDTTLLADPSKSFVTVTDLDGNMVPGKTLFDVIPGYTRGNYDYARSAPYKGYPDLVMTFLFGHDDPPGSGNFVVDHLAAGGAPYTVTFTATARNFNGSAGNTVTVGQKFGIDRKLAAMPEVTSPKVVFSTGPIGCSAADKQRLGFLSFVCNFFNNGKGYDSITMAFPQRGERVVVQGMAVDPLTAPWEEDSSLAFTESSGIAEVVIRLFGGSPFPSAGFVKSYVLPQSCTLTYPDESSISRCPQRVEFNVDLTPDLRVGSFYAFDVYAIDLAGFHHPLTSTDKDKNVENFAGPETKTVSFLYTG